MGHFAISLMDSQHVRYSFLCRVLAHRYTTHVRSGKKAYYGDGQAGQPVMDTIHWLTGPLAGNVDTLFSGHVQ